MYRFLFNLESPYKIHGAGSPYKKHDPYKLCGVCTFLTEVPHKMHGGHTKCIVATQNTRHFLLESFVWEEAIRVYQARCFWRGEIRRPRPSLSHSLVVQLSTMMRGEQLSSRSDESCERDGRHPPLLRIRAPRVETHELLGSQILNILTRIYSTINYLYYCISHIVLRLTTTNDKLARFLTDGTNPFIN